VERSGSGARVIVTIKVQESDDPRFVEAVASELRARMSLQTAPQIDVVYPIGRVIMF
jgi:hypothetical protein